PATATAPPKAAEPPAPAAEAAPPPAEAPRPTGPRAVLAQARKARDAGETDRALDLYGKVLSAQPDNLDALTGRGLCYFELGQYAPAEASFKRALQLDLDHPDAIMGLAETYRQQGRKTEALGLFERYLAVHPDGEEAAVARYAISQLKE
ncbi:MAG: tetratricopeptide repeat protein, partial [Anaeromyxobacteraceae bacterium]|nr:tetratricopeptide repeat protein [Anaeromyxobacteraceae bacterium]